MAIVAQRHQSAYALVQRLFNNLMHFAADIRIKFRGLGKNCISLVYKRYKIRKL